jgi:prepilin-type N-terminal cleavage/methylation domain-containing protein
MKRVLSFVTLAIVSAPALADVQPPPPGRGFGLAEVLVVLLVLAIAGFGVTRWQRGR